MHLVSHVVRVRIMADVQVDLARYLIQLRADPDARDDKVRGDVFVTSIRVHSFLLGSGCG